MNLSRGVNAFILILILCLGLFTTLICRYIDKCNRICKYYHKCHQSNDIGSNTDRKPHCSPRNDSGNTGGRKCNPPDYVASNADRNPR